MEQHYDDVFTDMLADIDGQIARVAKRIGAAGERPVVAGLGEYADRLNRLSIQRAMLAELRGTLGAACTTAAINRERASADRDTYVACDEANAPEVVDQTELVDWLRATEGQPQRVHLYGQHYETGELEKLHVLHVLVSQDDKHRYWSTDVRQSGADGPTVFTFGWDDEK